MAANTSPIFGLTPVFGQVVIGTQNTKSDGTGTIGTDIWNGFTAGADGAYVAKIRIQPTASVAATALAATTIRIFISTVESGATTTADTSLYQEITAAAQTAAQTTTATFFHEIILGFAIPANATILFSTHIANNANTAWKATVFGASY
jgi:hypothetical protein